MSSGGSTTRNSAGSTSDESGSGSDDGSSTSSSDSSTLTSESEASDMGIPAYHSSDDGDSGDEAMDAGDSGVVQAKCLYIAERFQIPVKGSMTVGKLQKLLAKEADHPADKLRMYHHGYALLKPDKTLSELHFGKGEPRLYYIYLEPPRMSLSDCYTDGKPDLRKIKRQFDTSGLLDEKAALKIVKDCTKLLREEDNMVKIEDPVSVIGDIHGQWYDMAGIITNAGKFGQRNMLFLGDYVDRGYFSSEVILYMYAAKINYPDHVVLLRGNHESRKTTKSYGSQQEFVFKYGNKFCKALLDSFDYLPVYGLIESKGKNILCCHGGISPDLEEIGDVNEFSRVQEPPKSGPLKDTLWADPYKDLEVKDDMPEEYDLGDLEEHETREKGDYSDFHKSSRGKGLSNYSYAAIVDFLKKNEIVGVFRGHEQKETGIEQYKFGPEYKFPSVTTVFSAPNYTDKSQNQGGVVHITDGRVKFRSFTWALHPEFFPWNSKSAEFPPFSRDFDTEDFVQYVNFNHHDALRQIPIYKLKGEYLAAFEKQSDQPENAKSIRDAVASGGNFYHVQVMKKNPGAKYTDKVKKETEKILKKYEGYDHFKDAKEKEDAYEKDPDDEKTFGAAQQNTKARQASAFGSLDQYFASNKSLAKGVKTATSFWSKFMGK